jgi:hypothetical protein
MSGKNLCLFSLDLFESEIFDKMVARKFPGNLTINLVENSYVRDLWGKNMEYYQERFPEFAKTIQGYKDFVHSFCVIENIPDVKKKRTLLSMHDDTSVE